nr:ATP-binding cassette domain-containing protein [Propionibacteriales bacterium]
LLSSTPMVVEPPGPIELPDAATRRVRLHETAFGWHGRPVVSGLDIELPPGHRLGIVGPSGSGKSTVAAALLRFIDPTAGVVSLDQTDLRRLRTVDVRRSVGLVDDDPHIFASTLAENVRLARPEAADADVQSALDRAHLGGWSRGLPHGLDTFVGDGAAAVSGGERARIALARSLLADQPVLVLDEPTAHLDRATARAVTADLLDSTTGRSIVLITHRNEDLADVDVVVDLTSSVVPAHG